MSRMAQISGSSDYLVDGVLVEHLPHVWDAAWPCLAKAVERFPNVSEKYTEAEVLRRLFNGSMQLWMGWSLVEKRLVGALVTEITHDDKHPDKVFCSIPLVGGERWNDWGDDLWTVIKAWAVSNKCTHALGYGRKAWQRLYGFDECGTTPDGITIMVRRLKG